MTSQQRQMVFQSLRTASVRKAAATHVVELVTSILGLKPYHRNGLQEAQQQLFAEAPLNLMLHRFFT